jgi:hypothetical protein
MTETPSINACLKIVVVKIIVVQPWSLSSIEDQALKSFTVKDLNGFGFVLKDIEW